MVRTFLISDIRGYSTFTRERGDATAARLAKKFADLARDSVEARGGRVIELRGDEALAVFESASQTVRAALELQAACREATVEDPELPLPVGVGVDCGEAIPVEDGYRGAALNMAARLCARAAAGEVLVTTGIEDLLRDEADIAFESRGAAELKGFGAPVEVLEALAADGAGPGLAPAPSATPEPLPADLDDPIPLADRERELRWLRGTWRQVRRGRGRVVLVSGPEGIGKTRLAAALAAHVRGAGAVRYAGVGGAAGGQTLAAVSEARSAEGPALYVVDDLALHPEAIAALAAAVDEIESRGVLVVGLFRETDDHPALAALVQRVDERGDGHRRLEPLGLEDVREIARAYVEDVEELPAESILRNSAGVPARVHELVSEWAQAEAERRLAAAAEWLAEGRSRQSAGLDFAHNVIARKLARIYGAREGLEGACPYKGLAAFEEQDAAYFYGRERLVGELAARTVGAGFLAVVGASGSGKSSAVMAGLLPSLAAGLLPGSARWEHAVMRPGERPLEALEAALAGREDGGRLVLVVDQFEEVFTTVAEEAARVQFIERLVALARDPDAAVVVVTIRADYTGHCAPYPDLAELLSANLVLVGPMSADEMRRAIELPARRVGLRVESSLREALVEEIGEEPGALPLLSTVLVELWGARRDGWLRLEAHDRAGGVRGAVARLAEQSYERLSAPERAAARTVLLRLVGEGEGDAAVRRRVPVSEFDVERDATVAAVLARLTEDRLLIRDDGMIELAHEALVREWPRLRGWLEEDVTGRQLRGHLTRAARLWAERDRDTGELYRGARLSATLDWAQSHDRELNALERDFLAQSRQASERDAERQRRTNRRLRGLLIGTAVFLVVALAAGVVALVQRSNARDSQRAAEAQALRSDAERLGTLALAEPDLARSFLLAVAGVRLQDLPETRGDLLSVLQKTPALIRLLPISRSELPALAVSPSGRLLVTGDTSGVVRFADVRRWRTDGRAVRLDGAVSQNALAFSPDGRTVAVATAKGNRARLYVVDVSSRDARPLGSWPSVPAALGPLRFIQMAFSPDGTRIAVAVATAAGQSPIPVAQRLLLLRAAGGVVWDRSVPLRPGQNEAQVEFTPGGDLVTSAQQGETLLWSARTGRLQRRFAIGGPFAVSPDGRRLVVAQNNANPAVQVGSLATLDLRTGAHRSLGVPDVPGWIVSLDYTPDGAGVAGRAVDNSLHVWDVATGAVRETFTGQGVGLTVAVTPDGATVLAGAQDGTVAAWDLSGAQRFGRTFRWHGPIAGCAVVPCIVINSRSTLAAESFSGGGVGLLDLRTRRALAPLPARNGPAADALAFLPDGRTLATGGVNGHVTLWDTATRSVKQTIPGSVPVHSVAASPRSDLLAIATQARGSPSSRVEVRDLRSGAVLSHHVLPNGTGDLYFDLSFSPDGRRLAALGCCQGGSSIAIWEARSGRALRVPRLAGHASTLAFSPDGRVLAVGTEDGQVVLWNVAGGSRRGAPIQVATGAINPISFSPDGRLFVASGADSTATLWDVRTRKRLANTFPVEQTSVPVARFTPAGDLLIENTANASLWPTALRTWERFACQVAGRDLSPAEWRDLLPSRPYRHVCPQ